MRMIILGLVLSLSALPGCTAMIVGGLAAGTVAYAKGDLVVIEEAPYSEVFQATIKGLRDLGYYLARTDGVIVADSPRYVTVALSPIEGDRATRIKIRVGTFGNQSRSVEILDEIRENVAAAKEAEEVIQ